MSRGQKLVELPRLEFVRENYPILYPLWIGQSDEQSIDNKDDILGSQSDAPSEQSEHDTDSELSVSEKDFTLYAPNYATVSNIPDHHYVGKDKPLSITRQLSATSSHRFLFRTFPKNR